MARSKALAFQPGDTTFDSAKQNFMITVIHPLVLTILEHACTKSSLYRQIDSKTDVNSDSSIKSLTYLTINSREAFITSTLVTVWGCVLADSSIQAGVVSTTVIQVYKVKKLHFIKINPYTASFG